MDDDGLDINAGEYRTEQIGAKNHVFVDPKLIIESMQRLVTDFNTVITDKDIESTLLSG